MIRRPRDRARSAAPRLRGWVALLAAGAGMLIALVPAGNGWAADTPNSLTIVGPGVSSPITVRADGQPDTYTAVVRQVSWMASPRAGDFAKPDPKTLGPKYTITLFTKGVAAQVYEVYPEATGGPRAHRPKTQPKTGVSEAWFYATVTLPNVLRAAGVPLPEPSSSGQAGGVGYADPQYQPDALSTESSFSLAKEISQARLAFAATAATSVTVLVLLFLAARLSRRRWTR